MTQKRVLRKLKKLQRIINKHSHAPPLCTIKLRDILLIIEGQLIEEINEIKTEVIKVDMNRQKIATGLEGIITAFLSFDEILDIHFKND